MLKGTNESCMDEHIARCVDFALGLEFNALDDEAVAAAKRRVIDTLGCGLGAWDAEPCRIARSLAERERIDGGALVLGTSLRTSAERAAFANGVLCRYLDGNDVFPGGGHPSDVIAPLLTVAEWTGASGRDFLLSVVIAYEIYFNIFRATRVRERGLDHVLYTAPATAAGAARLLGLGREAMANALVLAITPNIPLEVTRRGHLSMWKGCAAPNAGRNGVFAALLAREGMTGPELAISGAHGLADLAGRFDRVPFSLTDAKQPLRITQASLKCYVAEYHSQAAITTALALSRKVDIARIRSVVVHTYWFAYSEIGSEKEKWHPTTRETADHSMPFLVAAALVDGAFSVRVFDPERLADPRIHALIDKISAREDPSFTARFPDEIPCRIEVELDDGSVVAGEIDAPRGHIRNPMTDSEVDEKFLGMAHGVMTGDRAGRLLETIKAVDCAPSLSALFAAYAVEPGQSPD